jgi:hypothetical protein
MQDIKDGTKVRVRLKMNPSGNIVEIDGTVNGSEVIPLNPMNWVAIRDNYLGGSYQCIGIEVVERIATFFD